MCCVLIVSCCFQNSVSWKSVFLWVGYLGVCAFWLFVEPFIYFAKFSTSTSSDTLSALSSPTTHLHDVLQAFGFCSLSFNLLLSCSSDSVISILRYHWFFVLAQISLNPSNEFLISVVIFQLQNSSGFLGFSTGVSILLRYRLLDFLWASLRWLLQRLSRRSVIRSFPGIVFFPLWMGHFFSTYAFCGSVSYNGHLNLLTLEIRFSPSPQLAVFC